jgi:hypothetical protein
MKRRLVAPARLACLLLAGGWAPFALAQPAAPGAVDCQMLARMPNAPMSVQACQQRMAAHADMMGALQTPGGERAGDERMNCEAISAEMKSMKVTGVSAANAAAGEAAGRDLQAAYNRAMAEGAAMMGAQTARSAAAAAMPGNAAGHAAAMANQAEQKALQDRTAAQMGPARERADAANMAATADLAKAMRANPRFAQLIRLAGERGCH